MQQAEKSNELDLVLDALVDAAIVRDVSPAVAGRAREATSRGVRVPDGPLSVQSRRRIEAYFSAVVRRRAVRRSAPARGAAGFVIATVVEDLRAAGRGGSEIWRELELGWAEQVPGDVLEEYRLQLCG